MKARVIGYWVCTVLMVFFMLPGGIFYVMRGPAAVQAVRVLGFPMYFCVFLGVWKVLGAIALVVPGFPLVKEWAYAGMFFDLTGAAVAAASTGGAWWHVVVPLSIILILYGSWVLRPASRKVVAEQG
jgi:DoxX-like family